MSYGAYVQSCEEAYLKARGLKRTPPAPLSDVLGVPLKRILIIAPHPDDECIMAGLPIRAKEEWKSEVYVLPFSYGSKTDRQAERKRELTHAIDFLDFNLLDPRAPSFLELTRDDLKNAIRAGAPDAIVVPHERDGHATHIRCSELTKLALQELAQSEGFKGTLLESEYWQSMEKPNLLIPLSHEHLTKMGEALMMHRGEVQRNPYHLSLPAWAMDQMRRGSEVTTQMGAASGHSVFAALYRKTTI